MTGAGRSSPLDGCHWDGRCSNVLWSGSTNNHLVLLSTVLRVQYLVGNARYRVALSQLRKYFVDSTVVVSDYHRRSKDGAGLSKTDHLAAAPKAPFAWMPNTWITPRRCHFRPLIQTSSVRRGKCVSNIMKGIVAIIRCGQVSRSVVPLATRARREVTIGTLQGSRQPRRDRGLERRER